MDSVGIPVFEHDRESTRCGKVEYGRRKYGNLFVATTRNVLIHEVTPDNVSGLLNTMDEGCRKQERGKSNTPVLLPPNCQRIERSGDFMGVLKIRERSLGAEHCQKTLWKSLMVQSR